MDEKQIKKEFNKIMPTILKEAGKLALEYRKSLKISHKSKTGRESSDIVTNADFDVQELILNKLLKTKLKMCRVFCEENTPSISKFPIKSKFSISIDPIDGTFSYAKTNSSNWQIIIQLKTRYKFLITLIYYPVKNQFLLIDNKITLNNKLISCSRIKNQKAVVWDEEPRPSKKAIEFIKKYNINFEKRKKVLDSGFIAFSRGKYLGMYRLRINSVDSLVWAHITEVLGGKSIEIYSSKIIGKNFDFFDVNNNGYYKGEYFSLLNNKIKQDFN